MGTSTFSSVMPLDFWNTVHEVSVYHLHALQEYRKFYMILPAKQNYVF